MQDFLLNVIEYMNLELDTPLSELLLYIFSANTVDDIFDLDSLLLSDIAPALDSQLPAVLAQALGKV